MFGERDNSELNKAGTMTTTDKPQEIPVDEFKVVDVSGVNYGDIPDDYFTHSSCRSCLYWEETQGSKGRDPEERERFKRKWFNNASLVFGSCGKLVYHDGRVVAWAQYAPASTLAGAATHHSYPSEDAYLITCLAVAPDWRGRGLGKTLLKAIVEELQLRGVRAVETFARKGGSNNPSGPVELYLQEGFKVKADDKLFPLLRLDLPHVHGLNRSLADFSRD